MNCVYEPETIKKTRQKTKDQEEQKKSTQPNEYQKRKMRAMKKFMYIVQAIALTLHTHTDQFFENVSYAFNEN